MARRFGSRENIREADRPLIQNPNNADPHTPIRLKTSEIVPHLFIATKQNQQYDWDKHDADRRARRYF